MSEFSKLSPRSVKAHSAQRYRTVLSIAGSDSGGGAGIQADIKTIAALGCYACTAITALTAQNTQGVQGVLPTQADFLRRQIASVGEDMHLDAVKVGMVASLDNVGVILEAVERFHLQNLIFDPVMISSSGASLLWEGSSSDGFKQLNLGDPLKERALRTGILNLAKASTLFTPNLIEAEYLLATRIQNLEDMQEAAHALINMGLRAVLVKGGHLELGSAEESASIATQGGSYPISSSHSNSSLVPGNSFVCDVFLARGSSPQVFKSRKVESLNLHGTGCTLSSAIATYLAKGFELSAAIERGRAYLIQAIEQSVGLQVLESSTSSRRSDQAYYSGPLNHGFSPLPTDLTGLGSK